VAEVTAMLDEWHAGQERAGRFARDVIPAATQRTEATVAAYGGGRSGLDEVMAARRAEFDARLQAVQVELEVARLWAKLEFLLPDVPVTEATR
jgi:outer membrane protein TolC